MKIMCKCGNIEDVKTDVNIERFVFENCEGGILILACKKCNEVVSIGVKE